MNICFVLAKAKVLKYMDCMSPLKGEVFVSWVFGVFPPMTPSSTYCTVKKCHTIYLRMSLNPVLPLFCVAIWKAEIILYLASLSTSLLKMYKL